LQSYELRSTPKGEISFTHGQGRGTLPFGLIENKIMSPITVLIADRDEARRAACARLLQPEKGIRVVGRAQSGLEDLSTTAKLKPCILLLSLNLLKGKEIAQLFVLRQKSPQTKVILLTHRAPETRILEALSYGARGYPEAILKKRSGPSLPKPCGVWMRERPGCPARWSPGL